MALKQHRSHCRVKFFDDSQASEVDYNSTSYATQGNRTQHDGPRFPNLQTLFKRSWQAVEEDRTVVNRSVETVEMHKEKVEEKVVGKEGNVDMDAGEYIKRRHQNYLQRLASMNA